jgi:protein involved in polysaccharide export with SLBB domain
MSSPKIRAFARGFATLFLLALAGVVHVPAGHAETDPSNYIVGPGDVLSGVFYAGGQKQQEFTGTVSAESTITCPLLGEVKVGGLTTSEISRIMRERLAKDYFVDPQVMVSVKAYGGQVFVMGAVKQPGAYAYQEGLTVLRACLLAGGFTDFASLHHVKVTRVVDGKPKALSIDLAKVNQAKLPDLTVMNGDRIEVPRRRF